MNEDNGRLNFGVGFNVYDGEGDLGKLTQKIEELNKAAKSAAQALSSIEQGTDKMSNGVKEVTTTTTKASEVQDDFAKTIKTAWDSGTLSAAQALEMLKPKIEEYEKQVKSAKEAAGDKWIDDEDIRKADKELANLKTTFSQIEKVAVSSSDKIEKYSKQTFEEISQKDKQEMQERVRNSQQETYEKKQELDKQLATTKSVVSSTMALWERGSISAGDSLRILRTQFNIVNDKVKELKETFGKQWNQTAEGQKYLAQLNSINKEYYKIQNTVKVTEEKIRKYTNETTDSVKDLTKSEMNDRVANLKKVEEESKESLKQQNIDFRAAMASMKVESEAASNAISDDMKSKVNGITQSFKSFSLQAFGVYTLINAFEELGRSVVEVNYNAINNQRLMGDFSDQLRDSMTEAAVSMARNTGILVTDAQEIQGAWIRINEKYAQSEELLNRISVATAKFMNVGEIEDAEEAVKLINAAMLQFNLSVDEGVVTLNKWVYMADRTAMGTADEFGEAISKFGGQLSSANGTMDDAIVLTSLLGDTLAKNGSEAGNSLKTLSSYLYRDKTINLFESLAKDADDANISIKNADNSYKDFGQALTIMSEQYNKAVGEGNDVLAYQIRQCLGATRQADASTAILSTYSTTAHKYYEMLETDEANNTTYLDEQNEALMNTFQNKWNALYATITNFGVVLGNSGILDGLSAIMTGLDNIFGSLGKLDPSISKTIVSLGLMSIAFVGLKKIAKITGITDEYNASIKTGTKLQRDLATKLETSTMAYHANMQERMKGTSFNEREKEAIMANKLAFDKLHNEYDEGKISAEQYAKALKELEKSQIKVKQSSVEARAEELLNNASKEAGIAVTDEETIAKGKNSLATVFSTIKTQIATAASTAYNSVKQMTIGLLNVEKLAMLAVTAAVTIAVSWYQHLNNASEDQEQHLSELKGNYSDVSSEIDELNKKRANSGLTEAEMKRLKYLQKEKAIQEDLIEVEEKKAAHNAVFGANWVESNGAIEKSLKRNLNTYAEQVEGIDVLNGKIQTQQQEYDNLVAKINDWKTAGKDTSGLEDDLAKKGESLNKLNNDLETSTGSLRENYLSISNYRNEIQNYIDQGLISDEEAEALKETLAKSDYAIGTSKEYIYEYGSEVDVASQHVTDLTDAQEGFQSSISGIHSELNDFNSVIETYNDQGYLTLEQAADFAAQSPEYINYLEETADGWKLTADAVEHRDGLEGDLNDTLHESKKNAEELAQAEKDKTEAIQKYGETHSEVTTAQTEGNDAVIASNDEVKKSTEDSITSLNDLKSGSETATIDLSGYFSGLYTSWNDNLSGMNTKFDETNQHVEGGIKTTVDLDTANLETQYSYVNSIFSRLKDSSTEEIEQMRSSVNSQWDAMPSDAQSRLSPLKSSIDKSFDEASKSAVSKTSDLNTGVTKKLGELPNSVNTPLETTKTNINTKFDQMKTDVSNKSDGFKQSGKDVMAGLNLGLEDEENDPSKTIDGISVKMNEAFLSYWETHSPSKRTRRLGGYIIEGMAEGLMDNHLEDMATKLMSSIGDAFKSGSISILTIFEKLGKNTTKALQSVGANFAGIGGGLTSSGLTFPTDSKTITSWFGYRNDTGGVGSTYHQGIDIGAGMGEPIYAAMAGTVTTAGAYGGYGNAVIIDHGNGLQTLYGHQSAVAVGSGQQVAQGQVIGYVGSTGNSTGPHLHFSIMVNGEQVDPTMFLGSFAVGTTNIDHDGYAMLHEGEGVLTKAENATLKTLSALVMGVPDPSTADSNNTTKYPEGSTTTYNINKVSYDKNYSSEKSSYNKQKSTIKSGTDEEKEKEKSTIESTTKTFTSNVTSLMSKITSAIKEKYTKLHNERIKQLEKERDEQLKVHDERIDYLNAEIEKLQGDTIEDKEGNLDKLKSSIERWMLDDSTVGKAKQKELYDQIIDLEKEIKIDKLQAEIDAEEAIKDVISEDYTNATDEESSSYDSVLAELDKKMSDKYLADEASSLIVNNKLNEITQLLGEFSPDYNNLAYIMGDSVGNIIAKEVNEQLNNYKDLLYNTISSLGGVSTNAGSNTGVKETITKFASGGHVGNSEGLAYIDVKERILSAQQTAAFDKFVYDIMPTIDKNLVSTSVTDTNTNISKDVNFNKEFVSVKVGKIENHTNQDVKDMENGLNKLIKTNLRKSGVNIIT